MPEEDICHPNYNSAKGNQKGVVLLALQEVGSDRDYRDNKGEHRKQEDSHSSAQDSVSKIQQPGGKRNE